MEGEVLADRYELGARLGAGGMAEVRSAYDRRLQRPVAVKTLLPHLAAYPGLRERFAAEARTAARLQHPSAVAVYDTGEDGDVPFIVMELLPGSTLVERLAAGPADPRWLVPVAIQVLDALDAAHKAGLVHRDVKPGNILLTDEGRAKVADFGIAKAADTTGDLTRTGQVVGTASYLPPEVFSGATATPAGDVYSMGVVLYEALSGSKPFNGDSPIALAYAITHHDAPPLTTARPGIDPALASIAHRAMSREPGDRFVSAAAMAAALRKLPEGRMPADAAPPVPPPLASAAPGAPTAVVMPTKGLDLPLRPRQRVARRRVLVLAAVAAIACVGVGVAVWPDGGGGSGGNAQLATQLRDLAERVEVGDGQQGPDLAQRLRDLAQQVQTGGGGTQATQLARDVATWRESGGLFRTASQQALDLLAKVDGADVPEG